VFALLGPVLGFIEFDGERNKRATTDFNTSIRVIENALKGKQYLVNNALSIADLVLAASLGHVFRFYLDEKLRKGLPNLTQWYTNLAN